MDITYLGHACFKLRGTHVSVVTDPFDSSIGMSVPKVSADIVTISHDHSDHNNAAVVKGTARRSEPFLINAPGEYEVSGASVLGFDSFHDDQGGKERGKNTVFLILIDGIRVVHLGDLGHIMEGEMVDELDGVDVLLCPIGGVYTIDPKQAVEIVGMLQPSYVIPMHYNQKGLNQEVFGKLASISDFLEEMGVNGLEAQEKLVVTSTSLPEETEVVLLK